MSTHSGARSRGGWPEILILHTNRDVNSLYWVFVQLLDENHISLFGFDSYVFMFGRNSQLKALKVVEWSSYYNFWLYRLCHALLYTYRNYADAIFKTCNLNLYNFVPPRKKLQAPPLIATKSYISNHYCAGLHNTSVVLYRNYKQKRNFIRYLNTDIYQCYTQHEDNYNSVYLTEDSLQKQTDVNC